MHHDWLTATPRKERRTALFPRQQLAQVVQHKRVRLARASARARHALPSEQHWLPLFFNVRATQLHVTAMGVVRHQGKAPPTTLSSTTQRQLAGVGGTHAVPDAAMTRKTPRVAGTV